MHTAVFVGFVALFAANPFLIIAMIGRPRTPLDRVDAIMSLVFAVIQITALVYVTS